MSPSKKISKTEREDEDPLKPDELTAIKETFDQMLIKETLSHRSGFEYLNDDQKNKALDLAILNENNTYNYHLKKIESTEKIKLAQIKSNDIAKITNRNISILSIILIAIITIFILVYKDEYLAEWLAFIIGLAGGIGLGKINFGNNNLRMGKEI